MRTTVNDPGPAAVDREDSAAEHNVLQRLARGLWPNLPALLVGGSAVSAVGILSAVISPALTPLSVLLWGFVVVPVFAGVVGQAGDIADGHDVRWVDFPNRVRHTSRVALMVGGMAGVAGALFLVALRWWTVTGSAIALFEATATGAVEVLSIIVLVVGLPLSLQAPRLRRSELLRGSLFLAARHPVPFASVAALLVLGVLAGVHLSASLLLLIPVPLAMTMVAATRTAVSKTESTVGCRHQDMVVGERFDSSS